MIIIDDYYMGGGYGFDSDLEIQWSVRQGASDMSLSPAPWCPPPPAAPALAPWDGMGAVGDPPAAPALHRHT